LLFLTRLSKVLFFNLDVCFANTLTGHRSRHAFSWTRHELVRPGGGSGPVWLGHAHLILFRFIAHISIFPAKLNAVS
jgi:hypothetical protein